MIILASENLTRFVRFLDERYPTEKDVCLTVLHAYDSVGMDEQPQGWAVYLAPESDKDKPVIMLPGKLPKIEGVTLTEMDILESFAHEYCHHLQWCRGAAFDEDEADDFAEQAVDAFQLRGRWVHRDKYNIAIYVQHGGGGNLAPLFLCQKTIDYIII